MLVAESPIVIDVGNKQRNRPACAICLGDRSRGGIDESVVGGEPSVLIEKDGMLRGEVKSGAGARGGGRGAGPWRNSRRS
jgi:hypothetical protein